jgi:choline dehydrogenase
MLSGIGPAEQLKAHGITVHKDLPGVGKNLQEHPAAWISYFSKVSTLNTEISPLKFIQHGLNWLFFGKGPASSPIAHAAAFVKTNPQVKTPDIQIHFSPLAYDLKPDKLVLLDRPAVVGSPNVCRPVYRGQIRLKDDKPETYPIIEHQLISQRDDLETLIEGCKITRKIFQAEPFSNYLLAERMPGPEVNSDDEWEDYLKHYAALSYHFCGTCKMGKDTESVVDENLKVYGIDNLRVIDASIMPQIPSANTNGPVIMIAEKGADLVKAKSRTHG